MWVPFISTPKRSPAASRLGKRKISSSSLQSLDTTPSGTLDLQSATVSSHASPPKTLSSTLPNPPEVAPLNFTSYTNAVFYPDWACNLASPRTAIPFENVTHVYYTFIGLNKDGSVFLTEPAAENASSSSRLTAKTCIAQIVSEREERNQDVKLLMSVGGGAGSGNFSTVVSSSKTREKFASSLKTLIDDYSFDGVDVDWESPISATEGYYFLRMIRLLRTYFTPDDYLLTATYNGASWALSEIDITSAVSVVDQFNLMTYDFYGPWNATSGYHSRLFSPVADTDSASNSMSLCLADQNIDSRKLIMGVPLYAQGFPNVTGPDQTWAKSRMPDDGIQVNYNELGLDPFDSDIVFNSTQVAAGYYNKTANIWYSFDNYESVRQKASHVKSNSLGGIFYWQSAGDMAASTGGSLVSLSALYLGATT
ncbi:glycosyl hydrolases family 18-domain-containing protein [Myxozyma melibiosi]|uniref:chitinase n=1 Tax=Myxozyma melibiosi TaxID=54550 RepID=A0ABR1FDB4_9ASCO